MYFEFLLRRAHSRRRVERTYWSGVSLYSLTTCSKDVTVGMTGPMGSGLPQFGLPRRFAICGKNSFPGGTAEAQNCTEAATASLAGFGGWDKVQGCFGFRN